MKALLASALLLIPCFWQSRIQAGDLSSHVYNAWLARLVAQGQAPGLSLVHLNTNILFDWMLSAMPERLAVAIAVLIFFWGSFAFVSKASGAPAWGMAPVIGMLAYGWVFHMGFFNFYISLGLSFAALALAWDWNPKLYAAAAALLAVAWLAHALPVAFVIALLAYKFLMRRHLLVLSLMAIIVVRLAASARFRTQWFASQILSATALDQVWVFDSKYGVVILGLLLIWVIALVLAIKANKLSAIPLHFCVLTSFGLLVLPSEVLLPNYKHSLAFIADRMSLALGICICALLAGSMNRRMQHYLTGVVVLVFAALLFRHQHTFNEIEDRMQKLVATLPPNQRVIAAIETPTMRVNMLTHMIDRLCVGRCFSYANYEPSTAQFRVRVDGPNGIVAPTYGESWALQGGRYIVRSTDLPLYEIVLDKHGEMSIIQPTAGMQSAVSFWEPL